MRLRLKMHPGFKKTWDRRGWPGAALLGLLLATAAVWPEELPDAFSQDVARFTQLLESPVVERRVEGLQGLSHLRHWPAEEAVIHLLADASPAVRREAMQALGRLGTARSVPHLIGLLRNPAWELRANAQLELCRMTARCFPADAGGEWQRWWEAGAATNHEPFLLAAATNVSPAIPRRAALLALRGFASAASEATLISMLHAPGLTAEERNAIAAALERVGTAKAIPALGGYPSDAAAWALGQIGGADAEKALWAFPKSLAVAINLDRLKSTHAGPLIPFLVSQMGLVTYRGQPDDLMNDEPQPVQRVGANLIRRSGRAPEFIHQTLLELEYTMQPPPAAPRPPLPPEWQPMLTAMRSELKPGFVREDGTTTSQPLTAVYHLATDKALAPRLIPLLRHPAFVPRVYVAMTLGRLQIPEALPEMLKIIREGYAFSDAVALASGKHFDQSQTVRWRGFLCFALGRMGGDEARRALEELAADASQPRDIRYSSVVGLRFIGSPRSLPVLRQVAANDLIWMVRDEARRTALDLGVLAQEQKR